MGKSLGDTLATTAREAPSGVEMVANVVTYAAISESVFVDARHRMNRRVSTTTRSSATPRGVSWAFVHQPTWYALAEA
jgi:hypothetical protein